MILENGTQGRSHRSVVLGLVSDLPTRAQARDELDKRLRSLNEGTQHVQSAVRFSTFVEDDWMTLAFPTYKRTTQRSYRLVLQRHVLPYFGDWKLCDITEQDVQRFVLGKFRQGLAWQSVRNAWILLSSILTCAKKYGVVSTNAASGVRFPTRPESRSPRVLTPEECAALLGQLREPFRTMVALAALTGLRVGELLALRWGALNLPGGVLAVRESVFQGEFDTPKTRKSRRTIPLGPRAVALLGRHRTLVVSSAPEALLFANAEGLPYQADRLLRDELKPAAQRASVASVTWHGLRHMHSTWLHDLGVPAKVAQEQLGHASITTTLGTYTHVVPETHRQAIHDLEGYLFPSVPTLGETQNADDGLTH